MTYNAGSECYRCERTRRCLSVADHKVQKHHHGPPDDDQSPVKRIRVASTNLQDVASSSSEMTMAVMPAVDNSSSIIIPTVSQLGINAVAQYSTPPTPPRTPTEQTAFSLPPINEFDAGLSRLRTRMNHEESKKQLSASPYNPFRGSQWKFTPSTATKIGSRCLLLTEEFVGNGNGLSRHPLPLPQVEPRTATSDPSLGEMFAEAAQAAGRQFYPSFQGGATKTAMPSPGNPTATAASREVHPEEGGNLSHTRNEAGLSHVFGPPAPQSTTATVPDEQSLGPGLFQREHRDAASSYYIEPGQHVRCHNRPPPDMEMATGFKPVNQVYRASPGNVMTAGQHFSPTQSRLSDFGEPAPTWKHPASSLSDRIQDKCQQNLRTGESLQATAKPLNPFSGRLHRSWLRENPLPQRHAMTAAISTPEPSAEGSSGVQAAEPSSSSRRGKGKGKLVELPLEILEVRIASPTNGSFEE